MRGLPFFKPKNKPQFAGFNFSDTSSSGGGGGGDTSFLANKTDLTAIILTGTTNTSGETISAGTWFYLNGTPCIAKVDIASGATFTEGTNYEGKTVGSALSELNSKVNGYIGYYSPDSPNANLQSAVKASVKKLVNSGIQLTSRTFYTATFAWFGNVDMPTILAYPYSRYITGITWNPVSGTTDSQSITWTYDIVADQLTYSLSAISQQL